MTDYASTVPDVVDALDELYRQALNDDGQTDVEVHQADPPDPPKEYLQIGEALGTQEWATQASARTERYTVVNWLFVAGDIEMQTPAQVRARAFTLHALLAGAVRERPGLGIVEQFSFLEAQNGNFNAHPAPREWGYGYWIRFEVDVEAIF